MGKVLKLSRSKNERSKIIEDIADMHSNGEITELCIIYNKEGSTYATYFYEDIVNLIGIFETTKTTLIVGGIDMEKSRG